MRYYALFNFDPAVYNITTYITKETKNLIELTAADLQIRLHCLPKSLNMQRYLIKFLFLYFA